MWTESTPLYENQKLTSQLNTLYLEAVPSLQEGSDGRPRADFDRRRCCKVSDLKQEWNRMEDPRWYEDFLEVVRKG